MVDFDPPSSGSGLLDGSTPFRERVVVRRRRARGAHHSGRWMARASRRRRIRTAILCVGVLLVMAVGLYISLSRQDSAPAEGARTPAAVYAYRG
jgi:hypothetical protein